MKFAEIHEKVIFSDPTIYIFKSKYKIGDIIYILLQIHNNCNINDFSEDWNWNMK